MPGGLVVLTGGGAWQINGGNSGDAFTPTTATATPQSYNGCSGVPPIVIDYDILYIQAKGSIVRDLAYNFFVNIYTGEDISVMSEHLFFGYSIIDWAYQEEPGKVIWATRSDGKMLSLTFLKSQEIKGWARHDTRGLYKSVASISEGDENAVYCVVKRYIRGEWVQTIERFASKHLHDENGNRVGVEGACYLDVSLTSSLTFPNGNMQASRASGTATFTSTTALFSSGDVGKTLRVGGGKARITAFNSPFQLTGEIIEDITNVIPNDPNEMPVLAESGQWSLTEPSSRFYGLYHLEGETVTALADGDVVQNLTVAGGAIELPYSASFVTAGWGYQSQLQSLYLDFGQKNLQGEMKNIAEVTVRVAETRGLKMGGPTFDDMTEFKQRTPGTGQSIPLFTGDQRIIIDGGWNTEGFVCVQQDYPLPATILALIPNVTLGDEER
jgi:hypothetical protein